LNYFNNSAIALGSLSSNLRKSQAAFRMHTHSAAGSNLSVAVAGCQFVATGEGSKVHDQNPIAFVEVNVAPLF
jgi:hypothetical protein